MANACDFINRCLDMVKVLIVLPENTRIISAKLPETGIDYFTLHLSSYSDFIKAVKILGGKYENITKKSLDHYHVYEYFKNNFKIFCMVKAENDQI